MYFRLPLLGAVVFLSSNALAQSYRYHLNTISTCTGWYDNSGDYGCAEIRDVLGISPANFTRWNPSISLDCEGWEIYTSYCTWVSSEFPTPTTTTTKSTSTAPTPTVKPSPSSWTPIGCWPVGATDFPTLDYSASAISNISVSKCGDACYSVKNTNYIFAGISGGTQCLCGDFVRNDMTDEINKKCNIPCAGSANQTCGGTGFISVYQAVFAPFNETTTSISSSTSRAISSSTKISSTSSSSVLSSKTSTTSSKASSTTSLTISSTSSKTSSTSSKPSSTSSKTSSTSSKTSSTSSKTSSTSSKTSSTSSRPTSTAAPISSDGACGSLSKVGATCTGSTFGTCCSSSGYCGNTSAYCDAGCQTAFGICKPSGSNTSPDGTCGGTAKYNCLNSAFGNCCSQYGYCGNTVDHCSTGCQSAFGTCTTTATSQTSAKISTDGTCSGTNGYTCAGSSFGGCCSEYGWCGNTDDHCLKSKNCNAAFGKCT
ncbi:hypothetical protein ONS95_000732 [Cadophora gregata]|uniref:uncharacterized protein n=1 Tax=Cadophora gregata TaxID=51156 RepID=UPI0026DDB09E|nr:uncharacterized protein ONS95_000732 [Cadophora gregata]KAK0128782.1 hypothetical protein ONS95_000732 [Cadophora gregata]